MGSGSGSELRQRQWAAAAAVSCGQRQLTEQRAAFCPTIPLGRGITPGGPGRLGRLLRGCGISGQAGLRVGSVSIAQIQSADTHESSHAGTQARAPYFGFCCFRHCKWNWHECNDIISDGRTDARTHIRERTHTQGADAALVTLYFEDGAGISNHPN